MRKNLLNIENNRILYTLTIIFGVIVFLTVFQDFLESKRIGYTFYFKESFLFNIFWLLFIPLLYKLHFKLKLKKQFTSITTIAYILIPIAIHLLLFPIITWILSQVFYAGRYDIFKLFSYTLSNDFYKLIIVYSTFVIGYQYISKLKLNGNKQTVNVKLEKLIINSKRDKIIIDIKGITHITSEKPYILIHLENQKHLHNDSLKSIYKQLDPALFVRIHKSIIVNTSKITSYKTRLNGDFDLHLATGETLRLSRTYAKTFKAYFENLHQVSA